MEAENHNKLLQELAYRDPLTGVYNRRFFDERLKQELNRLRRSSYGNIAFGIAIVEAGTEIDYKCLIQYADHALYTAKQDGRGKIHITVCSEESAN